MRIHKEGRLSLRIIAIIIVVINFAAIKLTGNPYIVYPIFAASIALYLFVMFFFRVTIRPEISDNMGITSPCDGKVVVIEKIVVISS